MRETARLREVERVTTLGMIERDTMINTEIERQRKSERERDTIGKKERETETERD